MRASFAILAGTATLLLAATLILGLVVGGTSDAAGRSVLYAKHVVAGVCTMLFVCFVHVLGFTYFVVCTRMAKDAVETAGLHRSGYEQINRFKRRAIRWLLAGVLPLLTTGVLGALAAPPASVQPQWHLVTGLAAVALNLLAFLCELHLITQNTIATERIYSALPSHDDAGIHNAHLTGPVKRS